MMKSQVLKILIISFLIIIFIIPVKGQDVNFSQFYNNPIYYNPGLAGISTGMNIRAQYRKLWPRINSEFRTCNLTIDVEEINVSGGLGLIATSGSDNGGLIKTTKIGGVYSYRLIVIPREFIVQVGFEAAYIEKQIDYSGLVFSDQLDPVLGDVYESGFKSQGSDKVIYPDFSVGFVSRFNLGKRSGRKPATTNTFGAAFHHITQPNESYIGLDSRLPIKTTIHFNSIIPLRYNHDKEIKFAPALIYERQADLETFTGGLNVVKNPIYMGLWLRNKNLLLENKNYDALVVMLGINTVINNSTILRIGYSYDITVSKLRTATAGSHEITLNFELKNFKLFSDRTPSFKRKSFSNKVCFDKF